MTVAYDEIATPIGRLIVAATSSGLVRLGLPVEDADDVLAELGDDLGAEVERSPAAVAPAAQELRAYFAGALREFEVPVDWRVASGFRLRALEEMSRVLYGETITYKELASRAGNPRAARAAGYACATNPIPIVLPCHRVVGSDGTLHGFTGGLQYKEYLLRLEGVDPARL
jgi:methylated-DNA-[protein]-cysteine S-methyltransferase